MKKRLLIPLMTVLAIGVALPASAACYADYKAKRSSPLRLHYGVIELPDSACRNRQDAALQIAQRLERANWELLNVMSIFGQDGLAERKESAGQFFLSF